MVRKYKTYLCGPIGLKAIDNAREWRDLLKDQLVLMNIETLNPFDNIGNSLSHVRTDIHEASEDGNIEACRYLVSTYFIPPDLKMVKECDFVTMYIPKKDGYEICGSYGEITFARFLNKPVLIVTDRQMKPIGIPHWAVGCSTEIFTNWIDYFDYINRVYGNATNN